MKKIAKLSLVAAVAVAGLSTANAQPLEEAIKNVDVSGTIVYRYDDKQVDNKGAQTTNNNYKVGTSLKSKVDDNMTVNTRFLVGSDTGSFATTDSNGGDANVDVTLSHANFAYTGLANTTVIVGKQGIALPWTKAIDSDGSEQTGTGALALTTVGPATLLGGYFNNSNVSTFAGKDLTTIGAMANLGPVALKAVYLDVAETADTYFVKASGKVGPVAAYAQYAELSYDSEDTTNNDNSLLKVGVSGKTGMFNAGVTYAETGKTGTTVLNAVSENSAIGYSVSLHNKADSEAIFVDLGAQVMPKLHVGLNYDVSESKASGDKTEHQETFVQVTYKYAKNLSAYVRLADGENTDSAGTGTDYNRGRLQVEYKF